jgi:hypothetical protein
MSNTAEIPQVEGNKMFTSTHGLDFEIADQLFAGKYVRFRVGTCHGCYDTTDKFYRILAVENTEKGNGHFTDVLDWFENSCRRDGKNLMFLEILNPRFKKHLEKIGFKIKGNNPVKKIL